MSLVLRHKPESINIQLDDAGWVSVDNLLAAMSRNGTAVTREQLEFVVVNNDKQRFEFDESRHQIRARQGHSVSVELGYTPTQPPDWLCHGTPEKSLEAIRASGLKRMKRHHVHLHENIAIAKEVGARSGTPVILRVNARAMYERGLEFFVTENNVWLTEHVPPEFIEFPHE